MKEKCNSPKVISKNGVVCHQRLQVVYQADLFCINPDSIKKIICIILKQSWLTQIMGYKIKHICIKAIS